MVVEAVFADNYHGLNMQDTIPANNKITDIARQFDACFLQAMLKSDSLEQHFIANPNPLAVAKQEGCDGIFGGQFSRTVSIPLETAYPEEITTQPSIPGSFVPDNKPVGNKSSVDEFIKSIWPYAAQAAKLIGLDPGVLIAQAALETGWGRSIAKDSAGNSSNNLFNIKAPADHQGESVAIKTTEYIADQPIRMTASFKKYPTVEHSFLDYISLITGSHRYQTAVSHAADPGRYAEALQDAGYATDPDYANKILSIYQGPALRNALARCGLSSGV